MFVSKAFASDVSSNALNFSTSFANFIPLISIIIVFYFFIIRPYHKKLKKLKKMIDQVKKGDTVATSSGIIGIVNKVDETNALFLIEIAPKVEVKILKSAISDVLNKNNNKVLKNKIGRNDKSHLDNKNGKKLEK